MCTFKLTASILCTGLVSRRAAQSPSHAEPHGVYVIKIMPTPYEDICYALSLPVTGKTGSSARRRTCGFQWWRSLRSSAANTSGSTAVRCCATRLTMYSLFHRNSERSATCTAQHQSQRVLTSCLQHMERQSAVQRAPLCQRGLVYASVRRARACCKYTVGDV